VIEDTPEDAARDQANRPPLPPPYRRTPGA